AGSDAGSGGIARRERASRIEIPGRSADPPDRPGLRGALLQLCQLRSRDQAVSNPRRARKSAGGGYLPGVMGAAARRVQSAAGRPAALGSVRGWRSDCGEAARIEGVLPNGGAAGELKEEA